ncbi:thiol-disulfide isomerase or thioredoxin [Fructobacillus pseudoficulneus]|uniref:Thiol-disulfide isomerase or thioredoxin n=1 Tax=Fructobacillus pseudoficulneus TaxID=220714 RepID=A0A3F3HAJ8_9LACO|nr:thioredoxin family protein [Fructobacillus pseudoficulneus]GAP03123.1 thiol-disulfide isomerase or thioredoxin [Fructobacillus pseudoficulneus]SEH41253.1 Thioredoxin [Fructobacillus pseudoficulneus]
MYQPEKHTNDEIQAFIDQPGRQLMFLSADWCGDCKVIKPFVQGIKDEVSKTAGWIDADRDDNLDLATNYGLRGIPSFVLFEDGKKVDQIGHGERLTPKQITDWYEATLA